MLKGLLSSHWAYIMATASAGYSGGGFDARLCAKQMAISESSVTWPGPSLQHQPKIEYAGALEEALLHG